MSGTSVTANYDAQNRLVSFGSKSYAFTAAGELASVTDAATGQMASFAYDALGSLRRVVRGAWAWDGHRLRDRWRADHVGTAARLA